MKAADDSSILIVSKGVRLEPGNLVWATGAVATEQSEEWLTQAGMLGQIHYTYERPFKPEIGSVLMYLGYRLGSNEKEYVLSFIAGDRILNILYHDWSLYCPANITYSDGSFRRIIDIGAAFIKLDI